MAKNKHIQLENYLTLTEVAERTGLSYRTVEVYVTRGTIECERVRFMGITRRLVTQQQLDDFLSHPRPIGNPQFTKGSNANHPHPQ